MKCNKTAHDAPLHAWWAFLLELPMNCTRKLRLRLALIVALPEPILLDRLRRLPRAELQVFRRLYGIRECTCQIHRNQLAAARSIGPVGGRGACQRRRERRKLMELPLSMFLDRCTCAASRQLTTPLPFTAHQLLAELLPDTEKGRHLGDCWCRPRPAKINPLDRAAEYRQLLDEYMATMSAGDAIARLSERVGKSESAIYLALRLEKLPPAAKQALAAGELSKAVADMIGRLPTEEERFEVTERVLREKMNVRQTKLLVRSLRLCLSPPVAA